MQRKAQRQFRLVLAVAAAMAVTACSTWWLSSTIETRHLDLVAVLLIGSLGALLIAWSGKRS